MTDEYPLGSVVICRFAITLRPLTDAEVDNFTAGLGLPSGVGSSPPVVLFDYYPPGVEIPETLTTSTTPAIFSDATGAYHVALPVSTIGIWDYRGYGQDGSGNPVAATFRKSFTVKA